MKKLQWKNLLWSAGELTIFVILFWMTNLFIACMALVGCLLVQWIAMSTPSKEKTQALIGGTVFTAVCLSVCGLYYINQVGEKITWPQWYVFGQSATPSKEKAENKKGAADEKDDGEWKELLASLKGIGKSMDRNADGQEALRKEIAESQKSLTEEVKRGTAVAEETRDAVKAAREKAELDAAALSGKFNALRDFKNGDTSKAKPIPETERTPPQIVIPEEVPGQPLPRTVPEKPEPQKPATPPEPEGERGPAKGFQIPTQKDDMPTPEPIPQTGPKQSTPELRAKATPPEKKKGRPTFVVCSCENCKEKEHKHPITGWYDFDKDGVVEPVYDPCFYVNTGKAACSFKDWAWE